MMKKAVVIGGGLGGLATALTLSTHYDVTILEKNSHLGGKMQSIDIDGFHFDYGPNTLTMPDMFWRVIEPFTDVKKTLPFMRIHAATENVFGQHKIVFTTDTVQMKEQISKICVDSAQNYDAFIAEITRLYKISEQYFLNETFFYTRDYLNVNLMKSLMVMHPFKTLQQFLQSFFPNPEVCQIFMRFATYIGSSPYHTPATFALIAYFELVEGTYFLKGGASQIAAKFHELLLEQNVNIRFNETVTSIETVDGSIVQCSTDKDDYKADIFICNGDYQIFQRLLGRPVQKKELSTSAYIELIALKTPVALHHHNVLFSENYEQEFHDLRNGHYTIRPTVYSCYPFASDTSQKPALFVLINAPANAPNEAELLSKQVSEALTKWDIEDVQIKSRTVLPPSYIEQSFMVNGGAIYGQASNSISASFFKHRNKDLELNNLYYVGGTVHPGGGSPIVVNGGYQVAKRIINETT